MKLEFLSNLPRNAKAFDTPLATGRCCCFSLEGHIVYVVDPDHCHLEMIESLARIQSPLPPGGGGSPRIRV